MKTIEPIKQVFIVVVFLSLFWFTGDCQIMSELTNLKNNLIQQKNILNDSINRLDIFIQRIKDSNDRHAIRFKTIVNKTTEVKYATGWGENLSTGDSVTLYWLNIDEYLASSERIIGFIPISSIAQTKEIKRFNKAVVKQEKKRQGYNITTETTQGNNISTNKKGNYKSNRTIYTGPRGGRYYINKNGNKTYLKKE